MDRRRSRLILAGAIGCFLGAILLPIALAAGGSTPLAGSGSAGSIQGRRVSSTAPTDGQVLAWVASTSLWTPTAAGSGDITAVVASTGLSGGASSGSATLSIDTSVTVDKTTAQTLTNKTLTTPVIGSFANATHDHTNAAGGGTLNAATALGSGVVAAARLAGRAAGIWQSINPGGAAPETQNFPNALRLGSNTVTLGEIVVSWEVTGTNGGGQTVKLQIWDVTAAAELCVCTVGACDIAAYTPTACGAGCSGLTTTAAHTYAFRFKSTTDCTANPQFPSITAELLQ